MFRQLKCSDISQTILYICIQNDYFLFKIKENIYAYCYMGLEQVEILIASFPGLAQLFITCHTAIDESRVGAGNEARNLKLLILIYFVAFLK